jgi:hypothetical protein
VQRRSRLATRRRGRVRQPKRLAPRPDLLGREQHLLELVHHEAGTNVNTGDRERRVRTATNVRPQLVGELDEALVGLAEAGEAEPRRFDQRFVPFGERAQHETVAGQDQHAPQVADAGRYARREGRELFHACSITGIGVAVGRLRKARSVERRRSFARGSRAIGAKRARARRPISRPARR